MNRKESIDRLLPLPMTTAEEMSEYASKMNTQFRLSTKEISKQHFEIIERSLPDEFDTVLFCFTGIHRDWGWLNKDLHAYGVTKDSIICARKKVKGQSVEWISFNDIKEIRSEKKLIREKLIIETDEEEIQILVNEESLPFIVTVLKELLLRS